MTFFQLAVQHLLTKKLSRLLHHEAKTEKYTNTPEISSYLKLCDVLWPTQRMFSHDFSHVSRCCEHVRFSRACTEAKVISTVGVFGEFSLTGLQTDILGEHGISEGGIHRWRQRVPAGMAGSWPGGLQAQAHIPISRFVLQRDSRDSGYYSFCSRPRWGPIKDLSLWCFNPWLFERPSSAPDGACCMLGAARQCYGSHLWF